MFDVASPKPLILLGVDVPLALLGRPPFFVNLEGSVNPLDQPQLVIRIEDMKIFRQTGFLPVAAQKTVGQAMKSPDPHAAERLPHELFDSAAHLPRRFVGESHRQYRKR